MYVDERVVLCLTMPRSRRRLAAGASKDGSKAAI